MASPETPTAPAAPKMDPMGEVLRLGQENTAMTGQIVEALGSLLPQYQRAQEFEKKSLEARGQRLEGLAEQQQTLAKEGQAIEPPPDPQYPAVPREPIRAFGEGFAGETSAQVLQRTMMSLGLMAQLGMGLAGKYPQGAMAAFSGALQGWQKGDREGAERDWIEYNQQVGKAMREWRAQVAKFEALRQKHGDNVEQFKLQLGMEAARSGLDDRMVQLMFRSPDEAQKILGMQGKALQDLANNNSKLAQMMLTAKLSDDRLKQSEAHFQQTMQKWAADREQRERFHADSQQRAQTAGGIREYNAFVKPVETYVSAWDGMEKLKAAIVNLDKKGLLPKSPMALAAVLSGWDRDARAKNDPDALLFRQLWSPVIVGAVDRGMFDEKGVRAQQMFKEQMGATDNIAPASALVPMLNTLQGVASRKVREKATAAQAYNLTPATLDLLAGYERSIGSYEWSEAKPGE